MTEEKIKTMIGFNHTIDFTERIIRNNNYSFYLFFNAFLTNGEEINKIIRNLIIIKDEIDEKNFQEILQNNLQVKSLTFTNDVTMANDALFNGNLLIFLESQNENVIFAFIDTKDYPTRSINESENEKVVRGSRDGFTENIGTNIGLLRRRIKSKELVLKSFAIGKYTKTTVVLTYLKDTINPIILENITQKLENLKVIELTLTDKALEELLVNDVKTFYPLVKYTERPDTLAMHLYQGMFGILIDTSPSCILGPISIFDHLQHAEEFRQTVLSGTFLRIIRFLGIIVAFLIIPFWLLSKFTNPFHFDFQHLYNYRSIFGELILGLIAVELLRMASIHTPNALSTSMGLIAGLILGDLAIRVGLLSDEVVVIISINAIGSFITPSYELSLANKIASIILVLFVYVGKGFGLIVGFLLLFLHLATIKSFTKPYLYPLFPLNIKELFKQLVRIPYQKKEKVKK